MDQVLEQTDATQRGDVGLDCVLYRLGVDAFSDGRHLSVRQLRTRFGYQHGNQDETMTVQEEYAEFYLIGVQLFARGDYFEAHEAWEWHWKNTPGPRRRFFQGLIQVAVALCHFHNGNGHGARKLYRSSRAYLEPFAPRAFGIDVERLLVEHDHCFAELIAAEGSHFVPFNPELAPRIALDPPPIEWPAIPKWILEGGEPPEDE